MTLAPPENLQNMQNNSESPECPEGLWASPLQSLILSASLGALIFWDQVPLPVMLPAIIMTLGTTILAGCAVFFFAS